MADVFISYAWQDRERIEQLSQALESEGYAVWWDNQIAGGSEFSKDIERELEAAKAVIVAWSKTSVESRWVRDEAEVARAAGKIVPVSLDDTAPPLGFRQIMSLAFEEWSGETTATPFRNLARAIGKASSTAGASKNNAISTMKKPRIAVLPFVNMANRQDLDSIADGLTEDLITTLSSHQHLSISARSSVFAYKGRSLDVREVGGALGARYIVEGSIREIGEEVRITVQVALANTGEQLWAKKFNQTWHCLTDQSDELVDKFAGNIFAQLLWFEAERAGRLDAEEVDAWEICQRSTVSIARLGLFPNTLETVIDELKRAIEIEPDYALAHALIGFWYNNALRNGLYDDDQFQDYQDSAARHLQIARELARDDLLSTIYIGATECYGGMFDQSRERLEDVLKRNPALSEAWFVVCLTYAYLGQFDEARAAIDHARALAPEAGLAHGYDWYLAQVEFHAGNYKTALALTEKSLSRGHKYGFGNVIGALSAAYGGEKDQALKYLVTAKKHNPQLTPMKIAPTILYQHQKEKGARDYALLEKLWDQTAVDDHG